ncbi:MAG: Gfo/Idh/MocA family oxidoreductase [Candidatus Omnitrophica bacterium]|nr:Gfo/Idh/MocA family oxidoreductase [Candidatus Omnitrophota bacterium]
MAKKNINVAVVGAGYWGRNLVRVLNDLKVLVSICDLNPNILKATKELYPHLKYTTSYRDILKNANIDAVAISTNPESHYLLTKEALSCGKDVFVEKPLAMAVEQGRELVKLTSKNANILMVGHLLRYHPAISKLKELIDMGKLGKINYIYSNRLNLGKIRREENILWSFAPHDISVILHLLGEMPESVSACGGSYLNKGIADVTVSNLNFTSGVKAHIFVSWLHPYKEQKLVVVGNSKMAVFDDIAIGNKLQLFNHEINWVGNMPVAERKNAENIELDNSEPLLLEMQHFLECILKREKPRTSGENAIDTLKILQACQMSLEENGRVFVLEHAPHYLSSKSTYYVHPSSCVEQPSKIGKGTKIWYYSHIMPGAKIGRNCNIGQNVFIGSKAVVGDNVKIQNNVSIYDAVKIEDDVFCGPSVVFTNVINPRSYISRKHEYKSTQIKKGATLGANATVICGRTIGEYAFVGAGAVVTKDVPAFALVYGNPAKIKGWMCICANKLQFKQNKSTCSICKKKYVLSNGRVKCIKNELGKKKCQRIILSA